MKQKIIKDKSSAKKVLILQFKAYFKISFFYVKLHINQNMSAAFIKSEENNYILHRKMGKEKSCYDDFITKVG